MTIDADELTRLVAVQLGQKQVRLEDRLVEDLDVTSLDRLNLTIALEDRLQVSIREEDAASVGTVADLHDLAMRLSDS